MSSQQPTDVPAIADWNRLLDGKVAVVTGGGDGIGGAISRLFAEHGALVEIAEIDPERAERKRAEIEAAGGTARAHVVDVSEDDRRRPRSPTPCSARHGRVDVLVNNVGDYRPLVRFAEVDARVVGRDVPDQPAPLLRGDARVPRLDDRAAAAVRSSTSTRSKGMRGYPASRSTAR